jgi:DNA transformation protein and related proteins
LPNAETDPLSADEANGAAAPVSSIPNLGPASEAAFARAGITTAQQLRNLGADEAYRRLLLAGNLPHFIGYYVLVMGLQGRPWNDCKGAEKAALRQRFDAIKASILGTSEKGRSDLETALQMLGVVERR